VIAKLSIEIVDWPTYGTVVLDDNNKHILHYTLSQGHDGSDSFTYKVKDEEWKYSKTKKITINNLLKF